MKVRVGAMSAVSHVAAIALLTRAVELDGKKRKVESLALYKEGLAMLLEAIKAIKDDEPRVKAYRDKAKECMTRAEKLQKEIDADKAAGKFHQQVRLHFFVLPGT